MSDFTPPFFSSLAKVTLFSLMLSLGFTINFRQVISLWQRPGLLNRAILEMSVIVPVLAIVIGHGMSLPADVKVGLVLIGISPGTSLPLHYLIKTVKDHPYTGALQTTAAFLSIITVPLTIAIANEFLLETVRIAPFDVAKQLLIFQFLPLIIGIVLQQLHLGLLERNTKPIVAGSTLLLYALLIWAVGQQFNTLLHLGIRSAMAVGLLALTSLWIGHWVGGREITTRTLLVLTSVNHNVAIALFLAIVNLPKVAICRPVIALYVLISLGFEFVYFRWNQSKLIHYKPE